MSLNYTYAARAGTIVCPAAAFAVAAAAYTALGNLLDLKIRHGAIVENVVTKVCAKFNDDRL